MSATLKLATCLIFSLKIINCICLEVLLDGASLGMYDMTYTSEFNLCQILVIVKFFKLYVLKIAFEWEATCKTGTIYWSCENI